MGIYAFTSLRRGRISIATKLNGQSNVDIFVKPHYTSLLVTGLLDFGVVAVGFTIRHQHKGDSGGDDDGGGRGI